MPSVLGVELVRYVHNQLIQLDIARDNWKENWTASGRVGIVSNLY